MLDWQEGFVVVRAGEKKIVVAAFYAWHTFYVEVIVEQKIFSCS